MKVHSTILIAAEEAFFQGLCLCGWVSSVTFFEEADLLRALHAHEGVYETKTVNTEMSVADFMFKEQTGEK